jgi:hypothetical protein
MDVPADVNIDLYIFACRTSMASLSGPDNIGLLGMSLEFIQIKKIKN